MENCHASSTKTPGYRRLDLVLLSATLLLSQGFASGLATEIIIGKSPSSSRWSLPLSPTTCFAKHVFNKKERNPTTIHQLHRNRNVGGRDGTGSWWSPSEEKSSRFQLRRRMSSVIRRVRNKESPNSSSQLFQSASPNNNSSEDVSQATWSRPAPSETSSSVGVRKRVKAVLKKARSRTGVSNSSDDPAGLWIAEVASIGGLSEKSDLIIKNKPNMNGISEANGAANGSSSSSSKKLSIPSSLDFDVQRDEDILNGKSLKEYVESSPEFDGIKADVPTPPPEPLPFKLPNLSEEQRQMLLAGERVQEQSKMGREGSGYVVMDVKAPPHIIWESLLDFEAYPELIKTVRSMKMFTSNKLTSGYHSEKPVPKGSLRSSHHYGIPSVTRAAFVLSKFKLNIAAIHNYRPHPDGHYMIFNLDPECTNIVLQSATGIWYTQANPEGRGEEYTRVWLLCELKVSPLLPKFIVDYTAKRAMPRATNWLKPHVEPVAEKWAQEQKDSTR